MPITFIPFQAFVPDGGDHGPGLAVAENALPVHGSWRTLRDVGTLSSAVKGPPTGAYVHIYQQSAAVQYMRPDGDVTTSGWESTSATFYSTLDEVTADDTDFVFAPGAPSAVALTVALSNPGASAASNYILRWRYRIPVLTSSGWTAKAEVLETSTVRATDTATGSAVTGWVQRELALSGAEIASIGNLNNLRLRFTATAPGSSQAARPVSTTAAGGYLDQAGGSTNLHTRIDEAVIDDADYIEGPTLALGGSSATYACGLTTSLTDPLTHSGWQWTYRLRARNAGVQVIARLKMGSTTIKTVTHSGLSTSLATVTHNLTTGEAALITDLATLSMEFESSYPSTATSTETQYARPASDLSAGGWSPSSGATLFPMLDEAVADDGDIIFSGSSTDAGCEMALGSVTLAGASDAHVWRIRARSFPVGSVVTAKLRQGATDIRTETLALNSSSFANLDFTLTTAERAAITDPTTLRVFFRWEKESSTAGAQAQISQTYLAVPEPRRARITYAALLLPAATRVEVSWGEFQVPDATVSYRGDVATRFAGTESSLEEVTTLGFTNRSGITYGAGDRPAGWNFCSIGPHVVATNRANEVQVRLNNSGNFQDCITSSASYKPKARFCAPFRNQLLLADINLSGHDPDEFWLSDTNNIRSFDTTAPSAALYQPVRSCPGQLTGVVGGDFAVLFKRRSVHGVDHVGGATGVRIRDISSSIGAPLGRSIVSAEGMIYFWDGGSFRRTNGYDPPETIGSPILSRYMVDAAFSDAAIAPIEPASILEEDSIISSWYDPVTRLIWWAYRAADDSAGINMWRKRRCVIYSPSEDRWSTALLPEQVLCVGVSEPTLAATDLQLARGSSLFTFDGTDTSWARFTSLDTLEMTLRTKRQSIALDEAERPMAVRITEVLPVLTTKPSSSAVPNFTVTVRATEDVYFRENVQTQTYTRDKANEAGWFPHSISGAWFEFEIVMPSLPGAVVAVQGIYVRWEPRGRA